MTSIFKIDVAPRYTSGSPGYVDIATAERVMRQERESFQGHLQGVYGDEAKAKADRLGLDWIVWKTVYKGKTATRTDLLTGIVLIQGADFYPRFVPVYASDSYGYSIVSLQLKAAKIKTQEWIERRPRNPEGFTERRLLCVATENLLWHTT